MVLLFKSKSRVMSRIGWCTKLRSPSSVSHNIVLNANTANFSSIVQNLTQSDDVQIHNTAVPVMLE